MPGAGGGTYAKLKSCWCCCSAQEVQGTRTDWPFSGVEHLQNEVPGTRMRIAQTASKDTYACLCRGISVRSKRPLQCHRTTTITYHPRKTYHLDPREHFPAAKQPESMQCSAHHGNNAKCTNTHSMIIVNRLLFLQELNKVSTVQPEHATKYSVLAAEGQGLLVL